jgi:hypothetical protein
MPSRLSAPGRRTIASMGLFRNVEGVAMAVSHMPHDDGLGGLTLDDEFVGHQRALSITIGRG